MMVLCILKTRIPWDSFWNYASLKQRKLCSSAVWHLYSRCKEQWLLEGILFLCAVVVSFASQVQRVAHKSLQVRIETIYPDKGNFITISRWSMIIRVRVSVVLRRTVVNGINWRFDSLSPSHHQSQVMMTLMSHFDDHFRSSCQNVSQCHQKHPAQDYTQPDDHT